MNTLLSVFLLPESWRTEPGDSSALTVNHETKQPSVFRPRALGHLTPPSGYSLQFPRGLTGRPGFQVDSRETQRRSGRIT